MKWRIFFLILSLPLLISIFVHANVQKLPMGIATYSNIKTTQWLGVVHIVSFPENKASFQLNVVLNYEHAGKSYAIWVQDVALLNDGNLSFVDNIWNLTGYDVVEIKGNGNIYSYGNFTFYGYSTPFSPISLPITIYLLVNVTTNSQGQPVIYFWYNDGHGWVNYDTVTILASNSTNVYFVSSSSQTTPLGGYYDGALVVVGPGNGESVSITKGTLVYLQLFYWNGHNFQEVWDAYNVGLNTGETAINAHVVPYYNVSNGELEAELTEGNESIFNLWNPNNVSILTVYTPISSGCIYIYNESLLYQQGLKEAYKVPFVGGQATVTLHPGHYAVLAYAKNGSLVGEANVYAWAGGVATNVTNFSVTLVRENGYVNIIIHAYGNVTVNVLSPIKQTFNVYVNGIRIIRLNATGNVVVNASIFPGFYIVKQLFVPSQVTFHLNSKIANITLIFPNSTSETLTVYNGEVLNVPLGTKYVVNNITEDDIRWATQGLVAGIINESEQEINVIYYEQRLVNFEYKVINGQWNSTPPNVTYCYFNEKMSTSLPATVWVNYNSSFYFSNVTSNGKRLVLAEVENISNTITAYYMLQYYVAVNSPVPVYALINGKNETLTSGWYNAGTKIQIENIPHYVSNDIRYIILSISPSSIFTVNSPMMVNVSTEKQFLVTINGEQEWVNQGETITLTANIPFYETGLFTGTYNVSPGTTIVVNSPITETLVLHPNYILIGIVALILILAIIIVKKVATRKKKKRKRLRKKKRR